MVKAEAFIDLAVAFEAEVQVEVALEDEFFLGDNITVRFNQRVGNLATLCALYTGWSN